MKNTPNTLLRPVIRQNAADGARRTLRTNVRAGIRADSTMPTIV